MFKNILVAYEGSEYSQRAFNAALEIAIALQANIHVISIIMLPEAVFLSGGSANYVESTTEYYKKLFVALKEQAESTKININFEIKEGLPSERIIDFVTNNNIDLLSIGIRTKRSLVSKLILGSVAEEIVDNPPCAVLLIK